MYKFYYKLFISNIEGEEQMKKKVLVYLLTICMILTMLVGCTNSEQPSTAPESPVNEKPDTEEEKPVEEPQEPIKIVIYPNNGAGSSAEAGSTDEAYAEIQQYILDQTGILVESIMPPKESSEEKLSMLLASGDQLDCWWGDWGEYSAKNMIQPIGEYLDEYGPNIKAQETEAVFLSMTDPKGNVWGIGRFIPLAVQPVFLRGDWLDATDKKVPNTMEELEHILYAFKDHDPAKNGETIPLATKGVYELESTFVGAFVPEGNSPWLDTDNKIKPVQLHPGYFDFLTLMNKWYNDGIIYKESFGLDTSAIRELIQRGIVGGTATWFSSVSIFVETMQENIPQCTWVFNEEGIKGKEGQIQSTRKAKPTGALISSKCEHPEAVIQVLDWQYSSLENYKTMQLGIQDRDWGWDEESLANGEYRLTEDYSGTTSDYTGDFIMAFSSMMESQLSPPLNEDGSENYHRAYLNYHGYHPEVSAKEPFDMYIYWNSGAISENIMTLDDINRTIQEETTKFVMGARPLSEYEDFVQELYAVGLQDWIDEYTTQYNALK